MSVSVEMKSILEALLFAAEDPLNLYQLAQILETEDRAAVKEALAELTAEFRGLNRSFELVEVAGGYAFRTRPKFSYWLRRLRRQQVTRLSPAALETLAIIAYKQPTLKAEIERLRGVEVGGVLRMLMEKGMVRVVGRKDLPGRPLIYGTTKRFLDVFGLNDLKDLPTLEEMEGILGGDEAAQDGEAREEEAPLFTRNINDPEDDSPSQSSETEPREPGPDSGGSQAA